ncbi:MAG: hypothetical protein U0Y68_24915 [Blastocatellia bacterium]
MFVPSKIKQVGVALALSCVLLVAAQLSAAAQSTIFNIPTTDVVAKKKTYVEFDFIGHLESDKNGGFQTYVPRVVFGTGGNVEVGVNVGVTKSAAPTTAYIQPNIKWQFYSNEKAGTALSGGAILYAPLKDRSANDTFGLLYANASKKFSGSYGPRVTVGGYGLTSYAAAGADKGGAIVGYEQPIAKKASIVCDWFSGKNGFGYVTPGFSFTLPKNGLLNVGYSVGNSGRKNNGLFVYYGVTF